MGGVSAYLIPIFALILSATPGLRGAETVWSGLVIAENVAQPQPIPPELTRIEGPLKKFFGLHVDARGESEAGYVLNLKLYKEKELLLETDAKLSKRSPLVIKGPQIGSGQLLLVLVVQ